MFMKSARYVPESKSLAPICWTLNVLLFDKTEINDKNLNGNIICFPGKFNSC